MCSARAKHVRTSLDQLFDSVALSCIVGNGDAHLKNFGLLYSEPTQRDARLAPAYDIVNTTAYIPEDVLALDLAGNKSLFASRQGLLEFAHTCEIERPRSAFSHCLPRLKQYLNAILSIGNRRLMWSVPLSKRQRHSL